MRIKRRSQSIRGKRAKPIDTPHLPSEPHAELSAELSVNEKALREAFQGCSDIVFRPIRTTPELLLIYTDGLVDTKTLEQVVLKPLIYNGLSAGNVSNGIPISGKSFKRN